MKDFANRMKRDIERKIKSMESVEPDIIRRALSISDMLEESICELKEFIAGYTFGDDEEEILFFKEIKPGLFKYLLYYRKLYHIEINRPVSCPQQQAEYIKTELSRLQSYVERRLAFYRYYRSGESNLDDEFFLRRNASQRRREQYHDSFYFERDPAFSTLYDFTVSKIMANDMLQAYLLSELGVLENEILHPGATLPPVAMTWTGTKTELIELIYSLDTVGNFNYGKVPLLRISEYFEKVFNIDLGANIARNFYDMRIRHSPTPFLDRLREKLLNRMNDYEEKPNSHKPSKKK